MRLSPRDPRIGLWLVALGDAELGLGHVDAAVEEYHKAINVGWRVTNLTGSGGGLRAGGQDGRGGVRLGGGPPP